MSFQPLLAFDNQTGLGARDFQDGELMTVSYPCPYCKDVA